jgi:hypothetical protein
MFLDCLNGNFLSMEYACGQSCLHISLCKDLREVFYTASPGRCYYRYRNVIPDVVDEFYIKTAVGTVLINAVTL